MSRPKHVDVLHQLTQNMKLHADTLAAANSPVVQKQALRVRGGGGQRGQVVQKQALWVRG